MTREAFLSGKLFETGAFSISEVSSLTHIPAIKITRWLKGYSYKSGNRRKHQRPVWKPELPVSDGTILLSFNDLLEVQVVHAFREYGVPLPKIRFAIRKLRRLLHVQYPFSRQMLFTDGKELFSKLTDKQGKPILFEPTTDQYAIYEAIFPYLKKGIDFEDGRAVRWFPNRQEFKDIVVDPRVAFGRPTIIGTRMDIRILADAYAVEKSYEKVANWYEVETGIVEQAVSFHSQLKAA